MIHVRKHARQLGSGKTTTVRQHERGGMPAQDATAVHDGGSWWDGSTDPVPEGDYPPGTSFFRQGDEVFAAHPDGSVFPVAQDDDGHEDDNLGLSPEMARLFGADTPEGAARWRRARDLRESGYTGPIDQDGYAQPEPEPPASPPPSAAMTRMQDEMRYWRSLPEPQPRPEAPMSPQMAHAMGCDTPEGRAKYDRLRAYREAGYTGPLNQDNQIPDPDDPAKYQALLALAAMSEI
jgi:hypothetical protein